MITMIILDVRGMCCYSCLGGCDHSVGDDSGPYSMAVPIGLGPSPQGLGLLVDV